MKSISFSSVKFVDLAHIVNISPCSDDTVFNEWFHYEYSI